MLFRSVIKALESEINSIDKQIEALELNRPTDTDLVTFKLQGSTLLRYPDKAWQQADTNTQKIIFNYVFDKNIKVIDGKIGTAKYSLPYRVMKGKTSSSKGLVELGGIETPTSCVQRKRSPS